MKRIVLLRHGQSQWNLENRFTGWTDVDLTPLGVQEARRAGELLKKAGFYFDAAYTSYLKRAVKTLNEVLAVLDQDWLPVEKDWRLNEKHYGALQGLNKAETAAKYGEEQVKIWRRSYDVRPPALDPDDPRAPQNDKRYENIPPAYLPLTESLKDTVERLMPYWEEVIFPRLAEADEILVAAHGNSLRGIVKYLKNLSIETCRQAYRTYVNVLTDGFCRKITSWATRKKSNAKWPPWPHREKRRGNSTEAKKPNMLE